MIYDNKKLEAKIAAYNRDVEKRRNIVRQNRDVLHSSLGMLTSSHVKLKDWGNLCYFTGHVGRWNTVSS